MKKSALSMAFFLTLSFLLCGIQASLYFLPFALPYFWFVVLCYYSFNKNLNFSLICNLLHIFVISQFSSVSVSTLLICMNLLTLFFLLIRDRFHIGLVQISLSSGLGCLFFLFYAWLVNCFLHGFYYPNVLSWFGSCLMTLIFSPVIITILSFVDKKIHVERIDTLENLRI